MRQTNHVGELKLSWFGHSANDGFLRDSWMENREGKTEGGHVWFTYRGQADPTGTNSVLLNLINLVINMYHGTLKLKITFGIENFVITDTGHGFQIDLSQKRPF